MYDQTKNKEATHEIPYFSFIRSFPAHSGLDI